MKNCYHLSGVVFASLCILLSNSIAQQRTVVTPDVGQSRGRVVADSPHTGALGELPLESFDTFVPQGWEKVTNFGGIGWQQGEVDSQVIGFEEGAIDAPVGGGNFIAYASWATGDEDGDFSTGQATDQWLITPEIANIQNGDSLKFYLKHFSNFADNLDVLVMTPTDTVIMDTTASDTTAIDTVVVDTLLVSTFAFTGDGDNEWQQHAFSLTEVVEPGDTISIAFRERVPNTRVAGGAIFLDLVEVTSLVTDVAARNAGIEDFRLLENYPNPFNPSTTIAFSLPQRAAVTLKVYNLLGQVVATPIDRQFYPEGRHQVRFDASDLANGIYYYKIEAGRFTDVKTMTLLK